MQLQTNDGIRCDGCGMDVKEDFTYYSIDFRNGKSKYGQHLPLTDLQQTEIIDTFDYCSKCAEKIQDKVVEINKDMSGKKTGFRYCDLTNSDLAVPESYQYASVTKAKVKHSGIQYACDKCLSPMASTTTVCKCGHNHFSRKAEVTTLVRYFEMFLVCEILEQFRTKRDSLSKKGQDWNVTS